VAPRPAAPPSDLSLLGTAPTGNGDGNSQMYLPVYTDSQPKEPANGPVLRGDQPPPYQWPPPSLVEGSPLPFDNSRFPPIAKAPVPLSASQLTSNPALQLSNNPPGSLSANPTPGRPGLPVGSLPPQYSEYLGAPVAAPQYQPSVQPAPQIAPLPFANR